jgi:hypothetical protein
MKTLLLPALCALLLSAALLRAAAPAPPPRFVRTDAHIGALFRQRDQPPPPPSERDNPFRIGGDTPAAQQPSGASAGTLLLQATSALKVGGLVQFDGRRHVVINEETYQEGNILTVRVQGQPVYLRIREITAHSVVLSLGETEATLHF